jgi:ribosomal protein S18 acetylase RimI-like enzyme
LRICKGIFIKLKNNANTINFFLEEILFEVDREFSPALSAKTDIVEYVDKITSRAVIIPLFDQGRTAAFIAVYCNDYQTYIAYLTMLAVRKEYRSKGLGKLLVEAAIAYLKNLQFQKFRLEVLKSNDKARSLYDKLGFKVYQDKEDSLFMEMEL